MENTHRNNLRHCRQKIVDDVDVRDVLDTLIENEILDEENHEKILSEKTRRAQTRSLLDTLPTKGPKAYSVFLDSLRENYPWLAEEIETKEKSGRTDTHEVTQLQDLLIKGGVPHSPSFSISRSKELKAIKDGLSNLEAGQFLTLHGMPGSGKSVLAAESIRDPQITLNNFSGGVFWFKVGMVDQDQLLNRLRALCTKLDAPLLPNGIEEAQEILRKLFLSPLLSDSLLILDDVWKPEVIKTFTLPVRILVTTQDVSVMEVVRDHYSVVELRPGFTQQESLELFSSYLKVPQEYLPAEAKAIHDECKGSPMVISLIGSLISESGRSRQTQRQSGRWFYYLQNLKTRRYSKLKKQHSYEHESVMGAVQMSVDNLEKADQEKYEKLAVFLDDDPIPIKTLEILWNVDKYEVEDTMNTFLKKSLAMCEVDTTQDTLVYTLHDLQLDYLKTRLRDEPEKERILHENFVSEYFRRVNYRYGDLQNDGYIFSHLGYHLTMAGMTRLFPEIYLDLGYIEANLKATGPVDLLSDYRKYNQQIMGENGQHEEALSDFEEFCRTVGAKVSANKDADIIQLALREVESSEVYMAAKRLADQRPETLYLEWKNRSNVQSQNIATILHPGGPRVVKFLPDIRLVTGSSEGLVYIWNVVSGEILQKLPGHMSDITSLALELSEDDIFCTGSEDGTVKQWAIKPMEDMYNAQGDSLASRRKSIKRMTPRNSEAKSLEEMFSEHTARDESFNTIVVGDHEDEGVLAISRRPGHQEVAVSGRSGSIRIYDLKTGDATGPLGNRTRQTNKQTKYTLKKCHEEPVNDLCYNMDGDILASASDDCTVRLWTEKGEFFSSLNVHTMRVTHIRWLGNRNKLATLSAENIYIWNSPGKGIETTTLRRNRASSWTCLAASENCVAAGTAEDRMVIVWNVDRNMVIAALPGQTSPVTSLDFSLDGMYLASTSEETLMVWNIDETEAEDQPLSLGPPHMTRWRNKVPITAAPDDMNRMAVLHNGNVVHLSPVEHSHITSLQLSLDCECVVFGTAEGSVKKYDAANGSVTELGRHDKTVTSVEISDDNSTVVSGGVDKTVRIFYARKPGLVCKGHDESVRDVKIIANGSKVLSCSLGGKLKIWDINSGEMLLTITASGTEHATCLDVVQRNGEAIAAVSGVVGGVKIVELETGNCLVEVGPASCPVRVVKFSPDGKLVVTGHDTGMVQIWDAVTGTSLSEPLPLHSSWVTDVSISSDCSTLLTAGDRLVWWRLPAPVVTPPPSNIMRRKLSLPLPRSRRFSGSKSNRESAHEDSLVLKSGHSSGCSSPIGSPPARFMDSIYRKTLSGHLAFPENQSLPTSPVGKRKITKTGSAGQKELLQTFDIKGSSVNRVWVNREFTQFVTVDDAGICYILDEFIPSSYVIK